MKPKDKYENLLLALLEQRAGVEEPISYPIGLVLDPSSVRPLNCVFCRTHSVVPKLSGRDQDPMPTKTTMKLPLFQKIMDEVGKYLFSVWLCNWGEPLMNPHLVEMVNALKNAGVDNVGFSSNLSMKLSHDTIEALIKGGLDSIIVSLDGMTQESYSKYRVKGDLALALSNMERFVEAKRELGRSNPYILWQFLVFSHNEREVSEAKQHAERIGVDFKPVAPYVALVNFPEWLPSLDEYVMDKYKKKPEVPKQSMEEVLESLSRYHHRGCDWHYLIGTINSNGSVSPCCGIAKEADDFGSLDGKTFAEVWNNEMFRAARKYLKGGSPGDLITNVCANCPWPEIRDREDMLQDAFAHSPPDVRQRAKHLLPDHSLVKKLIAEERLDVLRQKDQRIADLEGEVAGRDKTLHEEERRISEVQVELAIKEAALYKIHNSDGWKALTAYYRIRDKVFAPNSISGILARRFLNLVRRSRRGDAKDLLNQMIVGTSLEPLARKLHAAFAREPRISNVENKDTREPCASWTSNVEDKGRLYDIQTLEIMKRVLREDSNCVDVGCHKGSILREMLRFAPKGTHFAFEPLPEMYQGLIESFGSLANLHLYDYALSDTAGETSFQHVVSNPGYSGFRQRRYDRPHEQIQQITVKTNLLDKLVPKHISIRFIKVDVEGAELQVFKGAIETIKKSRPIIVFEHGLGAVDYYGTSPENVYDLLAVQCGLKLFLMAEWLESNGRASLSREAFCEQFSSGNNYYFMAAP